MTSRILAGALALACLGGAAFAANSINTVQNTPTAVECVNDASGVGVGPWAHCQVIVDPATGQPIKPLTAGGAVTATPAALPTAGPTTLGALNASISIAASQAPAISFETGSSAFTGTISFQAQVNSAWISVLAYPVGNGTPSTSIALSGTPAAQAWVVLNKGYTNVRAIVTAYTSGSIVANAASSQSGDSPIGETSTQPNYVAPGSGAVFPVSGAITSSYGAATASFTPSTTAYASGYSLGGVQAITGQPTGGTIQNASASLSSGAFSGQIDLLVFNAQPGTYADNAAVTLSSADAAKLVGVIHLTDVTSLGGALTSVQSLGASFTYAQAGTTLYVLPIVRAAVTFAASSTVTINLGQIK